MRPLRFNPGGMVLVLRAGRRALWRHPVQTLLAVLGVGVGVAVVVAVDLANASAREAMRVAIERVAGPATHQVVGAAGDLDEMLYRRLRVDLGVRASAPVVEGGVRTASGRGLRLLGLDPFAEGRFRGYLDLGEALEGDVAPLVAEADRVMLPAVEAERLGIAPGDRLELEAPAGVVEVVVAGLVRAGDRPLDGLMFADIAVAQEMLGRVGRLDRIDLILEGDAHADVASALPDGVRLVSAASRGNALVQMSDAFRVNLAALSMLALVVGLFLVFNTMSFLVVRRRGMLGTLRALGVSRAQVFAQVLADAAVVAMLGTLLGLPLGLLLGSGLTELVLATVDELFFDTVGGFRPQPLSLLKGLALGLGGALLAGLPAAREAVSVSPREALSRSDLERRARRAARRMGLAGLVSLAAGGLLLVVSPGLAAGFVGLFAIIIGAGLLTPLAMVLLGRVIVIAAGVRPGLRLIAGGAVASLSRTGVAVAALSVAVASVIGVGVMIDSFRASVVTWLDASLRADYFVSAPGPLSDIEARRLLAVDGVVDVSRTRWLFQPTDRGDLRIWALDPAEGGFQGFDIRQGDRASAIAAVRDGRAVLVSEPFLRGRDLAPGDSLTLTTAAGERSFSIAGVFRDYGSVGGAILMHRELYRRHWQDDRLTGIGVYVEGPDPPDARTLASVLSAVPGVAVRDNRAVFDRSLAVFDQTFVITSVLRLLAAVVAFVGVFGALMALQLDRAREYATLRALGLTRRQLGAMVTGQSGLLGLAAGVLALPLGLLLAGLLVGVINRRAFGWSMDFLVHPPALVEGVALAVVAALAAALYPAWYSARREPASGLREE